jgi:hypothetical protein
MADVRDWVGGGSPGLTGLCGGNCVVLGGQDDYVARRECSGTAGGGVVRAQRRRSNSQNEMDVGADCCNLATDAPCQRTSRGHSAWKQDHRKLHQGFRANAIVHIDIIHFYFLSVTKNRA